MHAKSYYTSLIDTLHQGDVQRRTVLSGPNLGAEALFVEDRLIASLPEVEQDWQDEQLLREHLSCAVELVVFGGGHVALELYRLATVMGYHLTIVDEREEYCNSDRFPQAQCLCQMFETVFKEDHPWIRPYFVIITRGHSFDQVCLEHCLRLPHSYIGMIGSRAKVSKTFAAMQEKGFTKAELSEVCAPIGLDINAVTAMEIALSILAQIVQYSRAGVQTVQLDSQLLQRQTLSESYIVARVVEKHGSSPCEVGFQLAMFEDGTFSGTVGGGEMEARVLSETNAMLKNDAIENHMTTFILDKEKAGALGMICGGQATVLFQRR